MLLAAFGAAGVFLYASDWLGAWDGRAVSVRPARAPDAATWTVLISEADGRSLERAWPADVVLGLGLPIDALAIPPSPVPDSRPETRKSRFALHFLVHSGAGDAPADWKVVPTTSPRTAALALLVFLLAVAARNMVVGGTPWSIEPRAALLPAAQVPSGQMAPPTGGTSGRAGGRKGPPPAKPRRGAGRR